MLMIRGLFSVFLVSVVFAGSAQTFRNANADKGILHAYGNNPFGGGVSFVDFDQDGWDDISLASDQNQPLTFLRNQNGLFFNKVMLSGVNETQQSTQIIWVDYDNDGDLDLYVANANSASRLYRNEGNLQFTDVTYLSWLPLTPMPTYAVCWGDYDRDGWLDLYVTNRVTSQYPFSNYLYRNKGNGSFENVTLQAGVADSAKAPLAVCFTDINGDLYPDIYIAQDKFYGNTLLRNNGDGTFTDISQSSNTDVQMDGMGIANGDFDNDGDLDFYVSNSPPGNKLFVNNGDETFMEKADAVGVGFYGTGWGTNFLDFDNDRDLDLYASGLWFSATAQPPSTFFVNKGDGTFTSPLNVGFQGDTARSYGNAIGDINNDGFPDIMVNNLGQPGSILWQNSGNASHWLKVRLTGQQSNRQGVGSWISCWQNGEKQVRFTQCGISYMGQNSRSEFFGLANNSAIDSVVVHWPSGRRTSVLQPAADQELLIAESTLQTSAEALLAPLPVQIIQTFNQLHIQVSPHAQLSLLNWLGQEVLVQETTESHTHLDISALPAGYYLLSVRKNQRLAHHSFFIP
ncbi:MAG: CRTAC1 family protein [Bacteroidota bacterium]